LEFQDFGALGDRTRVRVVIRISRAVRQRVIRCLCTATAGREYGACKYCEEGCLGAVLSECKSV
jgi:hypothetical protein